MAQRSNILKSFAKNLPKMAQFHPILLLFLATFAPKATAEKPDLLTVTVDPQYITNVRRFNVYLMQAKGDGKFEDCESPAKLSTNPIEFTLDWSKCPRAVENPEQLQHLQIQIDVVYKGGRGQQQMLIKLEDYSHEFYSQVFGGGKAKLVAGESKLQKLNRRIRLVGFGKYFPFFIKNCVNLYTIRFPQIISYRSS